MQTSRKWQLQEAKSRFSEVIKEAGNAPQTVTLRGQPVAVIVSIAKYKQLTRPKKHLAEILCSSPISLDTLELPDRKVESMRKTLLA